MLHMESDPDLDCFTTFFNTLSNNKNNKIQRRFTHQQIKSLETIFQSESKLEPRKKLQLAKDLGLQPRQIAIWFQNKRARWKSKQLERDYNILRASYDSLSSRFELLNRENQSLNSQLKRLQEMIEKKSKSSSTREDSNTLIKEKVSDADSSMKPEEYTENNNNNNINMVVVEDGNRENWDDLECHQLGDISNQWLDFWS